MGIEALCAVQKPAGMNGAAAPAVTESDEGLVAGQSEVATPVPSKEPKAMQQGDNSPEVGLFRGYLGRTPVSVIPVCHWQLPHRLLVKSCPSCD